MMKITRIGSALLCALLLVGTAACASAEWREETKNGKVIRKTWTDGETEVSPEGYAEVTYSYNGTAVTERYFGPDGSPAQAAGGYFGQILTYGNKRRVEEIVYLDAEGAKAECAAGYARVKMGYTSAGGITVASYYDAENNLTLVPSLGYAQVKNDYRGTTLTRTTYLGPDKKPVDTPLGYAVRIQSVNKSNRVTGISFEHADGSAAVGPEGWASMKRELDKKNREISVKYYDAAGALTERGLGYAYETRDWENDRAYTVRRYNSADQQVSFGDGIAALRREMNRAGLVTREESLDADGKMTENAEGVAARRYEYDGDGRLTRVMFEGSRGDTTENTSGYAGYEETLDGDGFPVRRVYLNKGGKPTDTAAGYSEVRFAYDANHRRTGTEYYDTNGNLVKQE